VIFVVNRANQTGEISPRREQEGKCEKVAKVFLDSKDAAEVARADFHVFLFPSHNSKVKLLDP
jgi:hypothetical protein